jgi:hypothetical protein
MGFNKKPTPKNESSTVPGIPCSKVILTDNNSGAGSGEVWTANDLGIVMKDVKPMPGGTLGWTATSIELTEPEASIFEIPRSYKIAQKP